MWNRIVGILKASRVFSIPLVSLSAALVGASCALFSLKLTDNHFMWLGGAAAIASAACAVFEIFVPKVKAAQIAMAVTRIYLRRAGITISQRAETRLSVSALMAADKSRHIASCTLIITALFAVKWFALGLLDTLSDWGIILALLFLVAVFLDNLLLYFRVSHGYFGNTESEARELISYILKNSDRFDGTGGFKIFEDTHQEKNLAEEVYGEGAMGAVS